MALVQKPFVGVRNPIPTPAPTPKPVVAAPKPAGTLPTTVGAGQQVLNTLAASKTAQTTGNQSPGGQPSGGKGNQPTGSQPTGATPATKPAVIPAAPTTKPTTGTTPTQTAPKPVAAAPQTVQPGVVKTETFRGNIVGRGVPVAGLPTKTLAELRNEGYTYVTSPGSGGRGVFGSWQRQVVSQPPTAAPTKPNVAPDTKPIVGKENQPTGNQSSGATTIANKFVEPKDLASAWIQLTDEQKKPAGQQDQQKLNALNNFINRTTTQIKTEQATRNQPPGGKGNQPSGGETKTPIQRNMELERYFENLARSNPDSNIRSFANEYLTQLQTGKAPSISATDKLPSNITSVKGDVKTYNYLSGLAQSTKDTKQKETLQNLLKEFGAVVKTPEKKGSQPPKSETGTVNDSKGLTRDEVIKLIRENSSSSSPSAAPPPPSSSSSSSSSGTDWFKPEEFKTLLNELTTSKMRQTRQQSVEQRRNIFAQGLASILGNF